MNAFAKKDLGNKRLDGLTTLRFFAAAQVVVFHCGAKTLQEYPRWLRGLFLNGYQAVIFFFVLSGFVLTYSYYHENGAAALRSTRKDFWIARFARIYPVYALALLISLAPYVHSAFITHATTIPQFAGGIMCVPLLLQAWIPQVVWEWNIPAWSLSVEAFFYAVFPWLAVHFLRKTTLMSALLWSGLLLLVTAICQNYLQGCWSGSDTKTKFFLFFPVWHLPSFLFGMALGRIFIKSPTRILGEQAFVLATGVLIFIFSQQERIPSFFVSNPVLTPLFGILIFSAANCEGLFKKILGVSWLVFLGEASYAIYILHEPLSSWTNKVLVDAMGMADNKTYFLIYSAFLLIVSCTIFALFETRARIAVAKWLKNKLMNW